MSKGAKARFRETDGITKPSLHCYYISALKSTRVQPTAAELLFSGRPDFIRAKCAAKRERGPACCGARLLGLLLQLLTSSGSGHGAGQGQ